MSTLTNVSLYKKIEYNYRTGNYTGIGNMGGRARVRRGAEMSYTMLNNSRIKPSGYAPGSLEGAALSFVRTSCEGLRFDRSKAVTAGTGELDSCAQARRTTLLMFISATSRCSSVTTRRTDA